MLAIAVAVRVDVYGVIYAVALGLLLLISRSWKILRLVWLFYLLLLGTLLAVQYFFLLGAPPSVCYNIGANSTGELHHVMYQWETVHSTLTSGILCYKN